MLRDRQECWLVKSEALRDGDVARALRMDGSMVWEDLAVLAVKVDAACTRYSRMSPEVALIGKKLVGHLKREIPAGLLEVDQTMSATETHPQCLTHLANVGKEFAQAEKTFDELLTLIESLIEPPKSSKPQGEPKMPDLEEFLKQFQAEQEALASLGLAKMRSNLMVNKDWAMPTPGSGAAGSGKEGEGPQGKGPASNKSPKQKERDRRLAEAEARAAAAQARMAAEALRKLAQANAKSRKPPPPRGGTSNPFVQRDAGKDTRRWDKLVSQLRKDMAQGRGAVPPEEYRQAIEAYFRAISDSLSGPEEAPKSAGTTP